MANDYRILDERDIKNFQAGNKLEVTEIGNKVTYEHIGEPPNTLPSKEKILEYGNSFNITVPSVYDSTGHVKSETKYSFIMPQETDTSNFLTTDNFSSESPIGVNKSGKNITYSHDLSTVNESTTKLSPNDENIISFTALSAVDSCGHANQKTTYNFAIPDISNYPTKNDFAAVPPLSVAKDENNNTVTYSHGGSSPSKNTEDKSTDLTFGNPFEITIPSAYNNTGHVIETQKHIFTMPAAPNVNTSGFLKKDSFGDIENNPVSKKEENNKIIYYHTGSSPSTVTEKKEDLTLGGSFNITVPSAYNGTGHVIETQKHIFTMPPMPTIRNCIGTQKNNSFYSFSTDIDPKATSLDTDTNLDLTSVCFITFYPNLGYSDTTTSKIIVPGPFTIPVATYLNTMNKVDYPFQALKIKYTTIETVNLVQTIQIESYTVSITLQVNSDKAYFNFRFPKALFSKITVMGF